MEGITRPYNRHWKPHRLTDEILGGAIFMAIMGQEFKVLSEVRGCQ